MMLYGLVEAARMAGIATTVLSGFVVLILLLIEPPGRRLEASREGLRLRSRYFGIPWTGSIPVSQLEELRVDGPEPHGCQMTAISDARVLHFGKGLPQAELDYLCARVWQAIKPPG
jgi:hypothetical protein